MERGVCEKSCFGVWVTGWMGLIPYIREEKQEITWDLLSLWCLLDSYSEIINRELNLSLSWKETAVVVTEEDSIC